MGPSSGLFASCLPPPLGDAVLSLLFGLVLLWGLGAWFIVSFCFSILSSCFFFLFVSSFFFNFLFFFFFQKKNLLIFCVYSFLFSCFSSCFHFSFHFFISLPLHMCIFVCTFIVSFFFSFLFPFSSLFFSFFLNQYFHVSLHFFFSFSSFSEKKRRERKHARRIFYPKSRDVRPSPIFRYYPSVCVFCCCCVRFVMCQFGVFLSLCSFRFFGCFVISLFSVVFRFSFVSSNKLHIPFCLNM